VVFLTNHFDWAVNVLISREDVLEAFSNIFDSFVIESVPSNVKSVNDYLSTHIDTYNIDGVLEDMCKQTTITNWQSVEKSRLLPTLLNSDELMSRYTDSDKDQLAGFCSQYRLQKFVEYMQTQKKRIVGGEPVGYTPGKGPDNYKREHSFFQQLTSTSDSHTFLNVGRSHGMGLIPKLIQHCTDTNQTCTVVDIASKPLPDSPSGEWLKNWNPPLNMPRTFRFKQVQLQGEMHDPNMKNK